ncbi:MAG: MG2 domain-containing protein, partial [Massilia sp.]
ALVQLTNLQVSARLSPDHPSLLWVTAIDSGKPVGGAEVELWSCDGKRLAQAVSQADGRVPIAQLPATPTCGPEAATRVGEFWIVVRQGEDVCVLRSTALASGAGNRSTMIGHTILDRVLFKAGEAVSMQTLARAPVAAGFALPQPFKGKLKIYFNYDQLLDEQELAFDQAGSASTVWQIPPGAKLGDYRFTVSDAAGQTISQGEFSVQEYVMPAFDASLTGATAWAGARQEMTLSASLRYLAGGVAAGQPVTLRGRYEANAYLRSLDYNFADLESAPLAAQELVPRILTLDANGKAVITLPVPAAPGPMALRAEMEFADPNGETQTRSMRLQLWPRRHKVGLTARTGFGPGLVRFSVIVLDDNDKPLPGQRVAIDGAAAPYDNQYRLILPIAESSRFPLCSVTTDADGKGQCIVQWTRESSPRWLVRASAPDASSASFVDYTAFFSARQGLTILSRDDGAKTLAGAPLALTLRSPFVPATALVTLEREGVLASHVRTVDSAEQTIELPTTAEFAPGVTVHVQLIGAGATAMRSLEPDKTNSASSEIKVLFDSASHRLRVDLAGPGPVARPGQTVPFRVKVRRDDKPAAGARLTLLAYDDGLTALKGNLTTLVLENFWRLRYVPIYAPHLQLTWPDSVKLGKMPAWWAPGEQYAARNAIYAPPPPPAPAGAPS